MLYFETVLIFLIISKMDWNTSGNIWNVLKLTINTFLNASLVFMQFLYEKLPLFYTNISVFIFWPYQFLETCFVHFLCQKPTVQLIGSNHFQISILKVIYMWHLTATTSTLNLFLRTMQFFTSCFSNCNFSQFSQYIQF